MMMNGCRKVAKAVWEDSGRLILHFPTASPPDVKMISKPCKSSSVLHP